MIDETLVRLNQREREREIVQLRQLVELERAREQGEATETVKKLRFIPAREPGPARSMNTLDLAKRIEHAVLAPQATATELKEAIRVAVRWGVRALVVKPCHVAVTAPLLAHTGVKLVTVIGFPHGGQTTETKVQETQEAIRRGAEEVDMVLNIGALRQRDIAAVFYEVRAVVEAAGGRPVKVILETAYLNDWQKRLGCRVAVHAGAAYVKTSTGFAPIGATVADVILMRRTVGKRVGIKAAGGIRTYAEALALVEAGADLLGTSHTESILLGTAHAAA